MLTYHCSMTTRWAAAFTACSVVDPPMYSLLFTVLFGSQLDGYVGEFDLRDPGAFALQLMVTWYFGSTDPRGHPIPIHVGTHIGYHYRQLDGTRAVIEGGALLQVTLAESQLEQESTDRPRFGFEKCTRGDHVGRWINMADGPCAPPYCTGHRQSTVNGMDVCCAFSCLWGCLQSAALASSCRPWMRS